jgi:hypothetical protein
MSEDIALPVGRTAGQAEARQKREVDEGLGVKIYEGEEIPANYYGYVKCYLDPVGYQEKLARLKGRKGKSHQFSALELLRLDREAEIGTYFRGIGDWKNDDGTPMADTEENLKWALGLNFVRKTCWEWVTQEEAFLDDQKKALQGN